MKRLLITICLSTAFLGLLESLMSSAYPIASSQRGSAMMSEDCFLASDTLELQKIIRSLSEAKIICRETGQEHACIQYSKRLCTTLKQCYGPLSEEYLLELLDLSDLYMERLMRKRSYSIHEKAYSPYMQKLREDFEKLDLESRQNYWEDASKYVRRTLDIAYKTATRFRVDDASLMAGSAYNATLLYKGILLNLTRNADVQNIPQLRLEWRDIQKVLGPEDIAIEFFRTDDGNYGSIMLKRKWKGPKLIRLPVPKGKTADEVIYAASEAMSSNRSTSTDVLFQASEIVWSDRLIQYFPKDRSGTVYFSSDGVLLQTGIEYLPFFKSEGMDDYYTISEAYDMVRLSSTRELVNRKNEWQADSAALFGGIYYNVPIRATIRDRGSVVELPATLDEVMNIKASFTSNGKAVRLRTGLMADKKSFTQLNGLKYDVIHIATHGFYWEKQEAPGIDNPLERCGLLFAGSSATSYGEEFHMDGFLSAGEISRINLEDNDLVVLSACKTALGDMSSDGVFGLQRGFKMAGAGTIVMSLWKVNDDVTKELMAKFYYNLISLGQTKREAFNNAIEAIRAEHPEPYYWAAFIMMD